MDDELQGPQKPASNVDSSGCKTRMTRPGEGGTGTAQGSQHVEQAAEDHVDQIQPPEPGRLKRAAFQATFEDLYRSCRAKLINALHSKFVSRSDGMRHGNSLSDDDIDDIVNEAFKELWNRFEQNTAPNDSRAWLAATVHNNARKLAKDRQAHKTSPAIANPADPQGSSAPGLVDPNQRRALSQLVRKDDLAATRDAMARLDEQDRRLVELAEIDGKEIPAIASELGLPVEMLKKRLQRARKRISDYLANAAGSSYLSEADSDTYKPRTREKAIEALNALPAESARILNERYVQEIPLPKIAVRRKLSLAEAQELLIRAEGHLKKRYAMTLDGFLRALKAK